MRIALQVVSAFFIVISAAPLLAEEAVPPEEARKRVGEECTVVMKVNAAKNRLAKRGFVYLDSEADFRDPKNFAVLLTKNAVEKIEKDGIADVAAHFMGKTISARGKVEIDEEHKLPRIILDDPQSIRIVEKK